MKRIEEEDIVYFGPGVSSEEIDKEFNSLYGKLLDYKEELFKILDKLCPSGEDQVKLAMNLGATDGETLRRLIEKECEKRRLAKVRKEVYGSAQAQRQPIVVDQFMESRDIETVMIRDIIDMMLETQVDQSPAPLLIHKSRCDEGRVGAVLFSLYGGEKKGFALFFPRKDHENIGALNVLDEFGIKRKVRSNTRILDLDNYEDADVYYPETGDWTLERQKLEALMVPAK
jgi:hypothetical protein